MKLDQLYEALSLSLGKQITLLGNKDINKDLFDRFKQPWQKNSYRLYFDLVSQPPKQKVRIPTPITNALKNQGYTITGLS